MGAVILESGSGNNAAIAGPDGSFSITVAPGAVLEISILGYETMQIPAKDAAGKDIVMKDDITLLEETIVVGYGTKRKESLTGSISNINSDEILTTVHTSLSESLAGKIAGFQIRQESGEPGAYNTSINIRGFGTPLYVIDGIPSDLGGRISEGCFSRDFRTQGCQRCSPRQDQERQQGHCFDQLQLRIWSSDTDRYARDVHKGTMGGTQERG